jgi:hypothetical protein
MRMMIKHALITQCDQWYHDLSRKDLDIFYNISFPSSPYSVLTYEQLLMTTHPDSCAQFRQITMELVNMEIVTYIARKGDYLSSVKQKVIMCFTREYQTLNKPIACSRLLQALSLAHREK